MKFAAILSVATMTLAVACGSDSSPDARQSTAPTYDATTPESGDPPGPSTDVVRSWPQKWCQARPGMTRVELAALMGPPTSEFPEQVSWTAFNYMFNAFFDVNGRARQLDTNDYMLSEAEKAAFPCGVETRRL